jgi:hypothetical protein
MNPKNLAELDRNTPFGATVTWSQFASLVGEAKTVLVCFHAVSDNPKKPHIARAMKISKEDALVRAEEGQLLHPNDSERVYVYAVGRSLYFGGR